MIEAVIEDLCIGCNRCVVVCPTDVFDATETGVPIIARQEDCHTCMSCELHCPVDALYVAPQGSPTQINEAELIASGILGSYQRALGWNRARPGGSEDDPGVLLKFQRKPDPNDKVRVKLHDLSIRKYI
ncbi:ferredoxin family protein [Aureimonas fodinaquatilis]|uniref:Ferredoxin family protein n=1 Tax=Aureimonas fodinaquatilis TaxID=2565783 RepID=A0A5B0DX09_9HYPH|nr:ferredoxin family protein [Aureimonas fodinaquatilis]KAA0970898.1 ferredoxin family protein [Aureimonas fodinaquatilis]